MKISRDQGSVARQTSARASFTVCWVLLILFPNTPGPLKYLPQSNILSSVCFSKISSHKTASGKTTHDAPKSPKNPEISMSPARMLDSELAIRGFPAIYKAFEQGTRDNFSSGAILYGSIERIIQEVHSEQPSHLANCHRAVTSS